MGKRKKNLSSILLLLAGAAMIAAALALLIPTFMEYKKSRDTYDGLKEEYVTVKPEAKPEKEENGERNENFWYEDVTIRLSDMQELNEDVIGWIRFDNIEILSYPVLFSGDDEKYLRTDLYGRASTGGCIFMEGACNPDFEDCHTILYGHNMRDLSMFGSLKKYKTEDFYEENQYFTIYTNEMAYRYQIFSYRDVPETSEIYTVGFAPDDEFQSFINELARHTYQNTGVPVKKDDKVLTLSTCSTEGNRFVVHAVRVAEHGIR